MLHARRTLRLALRVPRAKSRGMTLARTTLIALAILCGSQVFTQSALKPSESYPNSYRMVEHPLTLPQGRQYGFVLGLEVDRNGKDIWVMDTCGGDLGACLTTNAAVDPIMKFDESGKFIKSFGAGMFAHPHGSYMDASGNLWAVDGVGGPQVDPKKGHAVFKFSSDGTLLLTLGTPGVKGNSEKTFNTPSDVLVAPNGDIFVADGHFDSDTNQRIVKFNKDGKFLKAWGTNGSGPGQFGETHTLAMDGQGRLFVGDRRNNHRIQIFDQDGQFLAEWKQFGSPSEIFIDRNDVLYVADALSNTKANPQLKHGIYIGSAKDGRVTAFIPDVSDRLQELVVADARGNVWGAFTLGRMIRKYVKQ